MKYSITALAYIVAAAAPSHFEGVAMHETRGLASFSLFFLLKYSTTPNSVHKLVYHHDVFPHALTQTLKLLMLLSSTRLVFVFPIKFWVQILGIEKINVKEFYTFLI